MAGSRREFYLQNLLDAVNGDASTYPDLVAGTREEKYFQNMIDAASGNDLTHPDLVPVWSNPEGWYDKIVTALLSAGGSNWELLATKDFEVNTTSTSETDVGTIEIPSAKYAALTKNDIVWVHVRDKAGKRDGYYYGEDQFYAFYRHANNQSTNAEDIKATIAISANGTLYALVASYYGIYTTKIGVDGIVTVKVKYQSANSRTIDGTFKVDVYKLTPPDGMTMFE